MLAFIRVRSKSLISCLSLGASAQGLAVSFEPSWQALHFCSSIVADLKGIWTGCFYYTGRGCDLVGEALYTSKLERCS